MINFLKIALLLVVVPLLSNCSQLFETIDLKVNTEDAVEQQEFNVIEKTLTVSEARAQNNSSYIRYVIQTGTGKNVRPIPESDVIKSNFPESNLDSSYKVGIGDTISFKKLIDNGAEIPFAQTTWPPAIKNFNYKIGIGDELTLLQIVEETRQQNLRSSSEDGRLANIAPSETTQEVIEARGRVGSDGSVLLLEVGRLDATDKTLNELRSEVRNILIRNGASPRFQLEISQFRSQRAYLTVNSESKVITLDDKKTDLKDILSSAGKGVKTGIATRVKLQRDSKNFTMSLRDIFANDSPEIVIKDRDHIFVEDNISSTSTTESIVGQDGNIVLAGIGKIHVAKKTLNEIRKDVTELMEKLPESENAFQLEVSDFSSQRAIINIPGEGGGLIPITSKTTTLLSALTELGISKVANKITKITLYRGNRQYQFTMNSLLDKDQYQTILRHDDRVIVEILEYKKNKVFVLGGITPKIIHIDPTERETLADILFTPGGVLTSNTVKRSEVYLLRGSDPVHAYHLDAQNPTRLIVADQMELRPNDILFVAEQPIISFNRALSTIAPLRILLRDIQDENIP